MENPNNGLVLKQAYFKQIIRTFLFNYYNMKEQAG